jgi:hypothetical protein
MLNIKVYYYHCWIYIICNFPRGCHGHDHMVVGFTTTSAINILSLSPPHGEVYSIQH